MLELSEEMYVSPGFWNDFRGAVRLQVGPTGSGSQRRRGGHFCSDEVRGFLYKLRFRFYSPLIESKKNGLVEKSDDPQWSRGPSHLTRFEWRFIRIIAPLSQRYHEPCFSLFSRRRIVPGRGFAGCTSRCPGSVLLCSRFPSDDRLRTDS